MPKKILCVMCDLPIHFSYAYDEWVHTSTNGYYCPNKGASVATYPED